MLKTGGDLLPLFNSSSWHCFSSGAIPTFHKTIVCPKETIPCDEIRDGMFPVKGKLVPVPD
jgi:hypothetical protein